MDQDPPTDRQAAIRALIEKWEKEADARDDGMGGRTACSTGAFHLRRCASDLEDLLRALPPEGVIPQKKDDDDLSRPGELDVTPSPQHASTDTKG